VTTLPLPEPEERSMRPTPTARRALIRAATWIRRDRRWSRQAAATARAISKSSSGIGVSSRQVNDTGRSPDDST